MPGKKKTTSSCSAFPSSDIIVQLNQSSRKETHDWLGRQDLFKCSKIAALHLRNGQLDWSPHSCLWVAGLDPTSVKSAHWFCEYGSYESEELSIKVKSNILLLLALTLPCTSCIMSSAASSPLPTLPNSLFPFQCVIIVAFFFILPRILLCYWQGVMYQTWYVYFKQFRKGCTKKMENTLQSWPGSVEC